MTSFEDLSGVEGSRALFLQSLWSKNLLSDEDARVLYSNILESRDCPGIETHNECIDKINKNLRMMSLKIMDTIQEHDGIKVWGLINTKVDSLSKDAKLSPTSLSQSNLTFFHKILDKILDNCGNFGLISDLDFDRIAKELDPPLKPTDFLELKKLFIKEKWLVEIGHQDWARIFPESKRLYLSLGPRAVLEFYQSLPSYPQITKCIQCSDYCILGLCCPNPECSTKLHIKCAHNLFSNKSCESKCCPTCGSEWPWDNSKHFAEGAPPSQKNKSNIEKMARERSVEGISESRKRNKRR